MATFTEIVGEGPCFYKGDGATDLEIAEAEKTLGVVFSDEYRDYLRAYGVVGINGHEITGITANEEASVVSATIAGRMLVEDYDACWYVVEKGNIDGILIWQNKTGEIIQTMIGGGPVVLAASLAEYIAK